MHERRAPSAGPRASPVAPAPAFPAVGDSWHSADNPSGIRAHLHVRESIKNPGVCVDRKVLAAVAAVVLLAVSTGCDRRPARAVPGPVSGPSSASSAGFRPPVAVRDGNLVTLPSGGTVTIDADPREL